MKISHILSVLSLGVLLVSVSCSGKFGDYCDKDKNCGGGNDNDRDACVAGAKAQEDVADDYDCGDKFDDYFDCLADKAVCTEGRLKAPNDACDPQEKAYEACVDAAKGKKNETGSSSGAVVIIDGGKK